MSVILCISLILCSVLPCYAIATETLVFGGGALILSMLALFGMQVTAPDPQQVAESMYVAFMEWTEDIDNNAQAVADWLADNVIHPQEKFPVVSGSVNSSWQISIDKETMSTVKSAWDTFVEARSSFVDGGRYLNIDGYNSTIEITNNLVYAQNDTVFTYDGNDYKWSFKYNGTGYVTYSATYSEQLETAVVSAWVDAMETKGLQVYKLPYKTASVTKEIVQIRTDNPITFEGLVSSNEHYSFPLYYGGTTDDEVFGFNITTQSGRYNEVFTNSYYGENRAELQSNTSGWRLSGRANAGNVYYSIVPMLPLSQGTDEPLLTDGQCSLGVLFMSFYNDHINWGTLQIANGQYDGNRGTMAFPVGTTLDITVAKGLPMIGGTDTNIGVNQGQNPVDVLPNDVTVTVGGVLNPTLGDVLAGDAAALGAVTNAGIATDTAVVDVATTPTPTPPNSGVEFPTGVFDGIWKYVVHLVRTGGEFIGFLGDCLSCMPQELSWCFYGGLVLLIFGAVISKMLL